MGLGSVQLLLRVQTSKVRSFGQWAAGNCAASPTASAGQYATSNIVNRCCLGFPVSEWINEYAHLYSAK